MNEIDSSNTEAEVSLGENVVNISKFKKSKGPMLELLEGFKINRRKNRRAR